MRESQPQKQRILGDRIRGAAAWVATVVLAFAAAAPRADFLDESSARLPPSAATGYAFASGDVDGNGSTDLFEAAGTASRLLINDGDGHFSDQSALRLPGLAGRFTDARLVDVDGDGDPDLLLANADGADALWLNNGPGADAGTFTDVSAARMPAAVGVSMGLAVADIDGDSDVDAVIARQDGADRVLINDGAGTFSDQSAARLPAVNSPSTTVLLADVNGDRAPDLLVSGFAGPAMYLNNGLGNFSAAPAMLPAGLPAATGAAFIDVDADGRPDLVLAAGTAGLLLLRNDAAGTFVDETAARMPPAAGGFAIKVAAADVSEDGIADLLAGFGNGPRLLINNGAGLFSDDSAALLPADPALRRTFGVALVDVEDLDLDLDLLTASGAGGDRLLINNTLDPRVRITISPAYVQTGDAVSIAAQAFDEDGITNLVLEVEGPLGATTVVPLVAGEGSYVTALQGVHTARATATDGAGNASTRQLSFDVVTPDVTPPLVTLQAVPGTPFVGEVVAINLAATDAGNIVSRSLTVDGVAVPVDLAGNATFVPALVDAGRTLSVQATVTDAAGNVGTDATTITINLDVSGPALSLNVSPLAPSLLDTVSIQASAADAESPVTSVLVSVIPPSGVPVSVALDAGGNGSFIPIEPGLHSVAANALNASNASSSANTSFIAVGLPDLTPPSVSLGSDRETVAIGGSFNLHVQASDDVAVTELELSINGSAQALDVDGNAVFTPPLAGIYTVIARARDAFGNEASATITLQALNPADDADAPQVVITSPADGAEVSGIVPITGSVADATLAGYELAIAPIGSSSFTTFAGGTLPVSGGELGQLDTGTLAEGYYQLRLSASDVNGTSASTTLTILFVDNLRLGRFTLEYEDIRLAAFGLPMTVQRTYDSASTRVGDFGIGWKLRLLDFEVRTDSAANVFITLPDGRRTAFAFTPEGVPFFPIFINKYTAPSGVHASLTAPGCESLVRSGSQWFCGLTDPFPPSVYELTLADGVRYTIDNGEVTRIEDRNGNDMTLGPAGLIASSGRSVIFDRDTAGRITSATDPNGGEFLYRYDAAGRLLETEDQEGHASRYIYDGSSNLIVEVQSAETVAELGAPHSCSALRNEYYADGRIAAREDAAGNRTEYAYDDVARTETVTDPLLNATTYAYDGLGRVLEVHDALGTVTRYTYDEAGNETSLTRPSGSVVTYTYDASGNRLSETHTPEAGVSLTSVSTYNSFGQLTSFTPPIGDRTEYGYDGNGNQIARARYDRFDVLLESETFTYDADGNRDSWTNSRGETTTYEYLPTGERIRETDQAGVTTEFEYDANGNRTAFIDGEGNRAEFEFDALNKPTLMRQGGVVRWQAQYNAFGKLTSLTDSPDSNGDGVVDGLDGPPAVTTYGYDCSGNLLSVDGPESETAAYEYDGVTNLTQVTDPRGQVTRYDYDPALRPTARTGPDGQTWGYGYNADGTIDEYLSPQAAAAIAPITHVYDGMQRLITRSEPERDVVYEFDDNNRLLRITEDDGSSALTTQLAYDDLGNLQLVGAPAGDISYTYGAGGQRASMTTPDGIVTHYSYDDGGRLASMTTVDGVASDSVSFTYDAAGRRTRADYSNGASTEYGYDGLGRIDGVTMRDAADTVIGRFGDTQDGNGNRVGVTLADGTASYAYDGLYRLTSEHIDTVSTGVLNRTFSYDAAGNRLNPSAVHGADNRLLSDAGGAYGYDLNGNRTTRGTTAYSYDSNNRLVGYADASTSAGYQYDYLGRRVLRDVDGTVTEYLYDGDNIAAELVGGGVTLRYTHGAGVDEVHMARVAGQSFFYHTDGLGSVVAITDATGNLVKRYAYDAWGNTLLPNSADPNTLPYDNRLRFVGREFDAESGLYHLRARAYDPLIGRFLQKDSLQGVLRVPQSLNLYAYARNNPVNFTDPSGRTAVVEYAFLLTFPNGREAAAALAGFLHGFGSTGLVFIGEFLAVSGNANDRDIRVLWDEALARTKIRMDEIKNMLGVAEDVSDLAGVASIPGAFKGGVTFSVGFEINISASVGPIGAEAGGSTTFSVSGGGFDNGVTQGLRYLEQLRPR